MNSPPNPRAATAFRTISWAALALPVAVGGMVLLGWMFGVPDLTRIATGGTPMKPPQALAFVLAGVAIGLCQMGPTLRGRQPFARTCAGAVLLLGLLCLAEYGLGWDLCGGVPLFRKGVAVLGSAATGAAAFWTSISFVLLGLALLCDSGDSRRSQSASQALIFAVICIALLGLAQDGFAASPPLPLLDFSLSVPGAVMFLVLAAGLLSGRPDRGALALVLSEGDGGRLARRLLPIAVAGPVLCAALLELLLRRGAFLPGGGTAIFAALAILVSTLLILQDTRILDRWGQERQQATRRLLRLNRTLRMLSECNQSLVRAVNEAAFLEQLCRVLVQAGQYRMAWVGYAEQDEARTVRPAAQDGFDEGYLQQSQVTWADEPRGRGPVGTAVRTGQPCVVQDIRNDARFAPWHDEAARRGYASVAALPLLDEGQAFGALTLYAAETQAFDAEELVLLRELADDMAFGIVTLRARERQRHAEEALRESRAFLEQAQTVAHLGSWTSAASPARTLVWSREVYRIFGLSEADFNGTVEGFRARVHPADRVRVEAASRAAWEHGVPYTLDHRIIRPDGTVRWVQEQAELIRDAEGRPLRMLGVVQDITERKRAEDRISIFAELGRRLSAASTSREAAKVITTVADDLFGWDSASLGLYSITKGQIERILSVDTIAGKRVDSFPDSTMEPPSPLVRKTIAEGPQLVLRGPPPAFSADLYPVGDTTRPPASLMFAPIHLTADVVGVLSIQSYTPNAYDRQALALLQALADHCGGALERIRAGESLRRERLLLRTVIDHLPDSIYMKDRDGRKTLANRVEFEYLGVRTEAEALGKTDFDVYSADLAAATTADDQQVLQGGRAILDREELIVSPGGRQRWLLTSKLPLKDEHGQIIGLVGIGHDVTARKRAEEALANERTLLRTLVDHLPVAVYLKDTAGRITLTNPQNLVWFNATSEAEILGKTDFDFFPPEQAAGFFADEQALMKSGQPLLNHEEKVTPPGGSTRWNLVSKVPLFDAAGQAIGLAGIGLDITERKQAEERLRQSEEHYRSLFENMMNGYAFCRMHLEQDRPQDFTYLAVNNAFEALTGLQHVIGRKVSEVIPGLRESNPELLETFGRVARTGVPERFETYVEPLKMWFAVSVYRPQMGCFAAVFDVITERKQAEERLRLQASALESAANAIVITNPAGNIEWVNSAFTRLTGYALAEVIGQNPRALKSGRHDPAFYADLWQTILAGRVWRGEMVNKRKDGTLYSEELTITPVRNDAGKIAHFIAIKQDITERKRIEETLAHERNLLLTLINHLPDFIYVKDAQCRYLLSNNANARLLGLTAPEQTLGKTDRDFFPAELAEEYWATERKVLDTGQPLIEVEERLLGEPGQQRWQATTQVPLRDPQGKVIGLVGIGRDITERKRTEEEIRRLNAELETRVVQRTAALEVANKELEAFSYSVSHDLRSPLRAIDGYARILTEDHRERLDAEGQRVVDVICAEARRMGQLIDDLLRFSRLGRQEIRRGAVDMTALARSVFQELTALEPRRTVQWELAPLPPAWGDAALLRQVWANLLSNALKFTQNRDRAVIQAGSRPEGGQMIYFVKDNGAGFDMRYAPKLFGVFQRLHRNDEFPGTGVGLALAQRIIHRHGGRVWAEAQVNEGAAFYFSLPNPSLPA